MSNKNLLSQETQLTQEAVASANASAIAPTTTPSHYVPRIVDAQIEKYLTLFGAIEISGTKWCGKTWSSLAHGNSVTYVDRGANLQIATADPAYALVGNQPHVIDEWQRVPSIWDTVRHAVDELAGKKGAWILTGSSTPHQNNVAHSGAGRIGRIRMHPMTLSETGESSGQVSLSQLFDGKFSPAQCQSDIADIAQAAAKGGWPEVRTQTSQDTQIIMRDYLESMFVQSVPQLGGNEEIARRLALSLARNLGQSAKIVTLAKDVYALEANSKVSETQRKEITLHLELLRRIFFIDEIPGWVPASRSPKRMRVKPKRYFADPSLPVALLGLSPEALLQDWQTFGLVFENLVMRDLDVYARALDFTISHPVRYYHDDSGQEIDAIIERSDGRWAAIELKIGLDKIEAAAAQLISVCEKICGNSKAKVPQPSFMAIITATGEAAYQRNDGVYVVPIRLLGA